jgi:NitT/TauT family transport system ATP-binding protein
MNRASELAQGIVIAGYSHAFQFVDGDQVKVIEALREVSCKVPAGQFISIVGPSGCGKTTLLNILAGLEKPQGGKILIDGELPRAGRDDIAYMFARPALLPWRTVIENVAFGMEMRGIGFQERSDRARELVKRVNLDGFEKAYPAQLSQGMRQRVALARTFALHSRYFLMDEPFGALDAHTKLQLEQELLQLYEIEPQKTVVFVTHDLGEAILLSDRIIVMTDRPGTVNVDMMTDLPRPRSINALQGSSDYHEMYRKLWSSMVKTRE